MSATATDRDRVVLVEEQRAHPRRLTVELKVREALQRPLDPQLQLQPGEVGAEAEMLAAAAKRLVLIQSLAGDVELVRIREHGLVAIGRQIPQQDAVVLLD